MSYLLRVCQIIKNFTFHRIHFVQKLFKLEISVKEMSPFGCLDTLAEAPAKIRSPVLKKPARVKISGSLNSFTLRLRLKFFTSVLRVEYRGQRRFWKNKGFIRQFQTLWCLHFNWVCSQLLLKNSIVLTEIKSGFGRYLL